MKTSNIFHADSIDWDFARQRFTEVGFIQVNGLIPESYYENIEWAYLTLLKKYAPERFGEFLGPRSLDGQEFHEAVIRFKLEMPRLSGAVYDAMQCALPIIQLSCGPELTYSVSRLAGVSTVEISNFNHGLLMAAPEDQRNFVGWHQDTFNDEAYHDYRAGVTAWMPMHLNDQENGALTVCLGSHVERVARVAEVQQDGNASLRYRLPQDYLDRYPRQQVAANRGDAIFISMNIAHTAGVNHSGRMRYTVQNRYYPVTDKYFVAGKPIYKSSTLN